MENNIGFGCGHETPPDGKQIRRGGGPIIKLSLDITNRLTDMPTGIGIYVENLYKGLEGISPNIEIRPFYSLAYRGKARKFLPDFIDHRKLSWHYKNLNIHQLFNDSHISHSTDIKFLNLPRTKKIATIHDLAIFQKETLSIQDYASEGLKQKQLASLRLMSEKADALITVSENTKRDFLEMFPRFDEKRIRTIYIAGSTHDFEAGNEREILETFGVSPKSYFVFFGTVSIRKNLINIIRGFKESGLSDDTKFLLVGLAGGGINRIRAAIRDNDLEKSVILTGYVENRNIPVLYRNSLGLVFPTFYEGFGMPIIEAMNFRIPFMCGNIGSAPEIANDFGVKVDPFSPDDIAGGFGELVKETDLEGAYRYSSGFTWEKCVRETFEFYREVLDHF